MQPPSASGILGVLGTLCVAASVCAQTPAPTPPPAPKTLSPAALAAEPYYLKSINTQNTMNADGTGTRVQTFSIVIQSDSAARSFSVLMISFASHSEHADFTHVRVTHADGSTQETPVADAIEQPAPVTRQAPLYSDLETKQLPVKSLRVGDTLDWQARFTIYHAETPGQFWGQDTFDTGAVTLDETYELRVPTGLHLTVWTNPRAGGAFAESNEAGQHLYRWSHANLKPTIGTEAEAAKIAEDKRVLTADEELDAEKGKLPDFAFTTFSDWAAVGAWYRTLVTDRTIPDDAIKAKVAELTAGKTTDLEKAQAVYAFVSTHIRYVGIDFGIGRYQPHTATEVFTNQYGDCKDKHILLASMLSVLNLHADPVLVGAGIRFQTAVPSPASFNHVITRLSLGGKDIWLDSTAEIGIWGALLKGIRDQDALVISAPPAVVAHTPAELPYPQFSNAKVIGTLDKSLTSESKMTFTFHDDSELIIRSVLRNISPSDYGTLVQRMMANLGFGGTTSEPEIEHLEDPSQPLVIAFHYHRVKEKDWGDNRITAAFQPITLPAFAPDQPPTSTIELGALRTEDSTIEMRLPDGWTAMLPSAIHIHTAFANCDITYSLKDLTLSAERRLAVLQTRLPIKSYKQYQSWYDDCGAGSVPFIQLSPFAPKVTVSSTVPEVKAPDLTAGPAAVKPSDPKAADLISQAGQSVQSFDLDNARKLLDQAAAINSTEKGLWLGYATIAQQLGINTQAVQDVQRELTYHPDEVQLYPYVAQAELGIGDNKAALATYRAWVKADSDSQPAALALANYLLNNKAPADALTAARAAIARIHPTGDDLTALSIVAANAQVALGHASEAANSIAPLLKDATDPFQINAIAYVLAEGSAFLPEAQRAETKVIADLEAETADWTTTGDLRQMLSQQFNLAADWDTLGLILFHNGQFSKAYDYLGPALHSINNQEVRDHITALNVVLHDPAVTATLHAEDQKLRTFPLGPANGRQGVASLTLVLGDGKVLDSTSESDSTGPSALPAEAVTQLLKAADVRALFPPDSKVRLVRHAFVNCHGGVCELILAPLDGRITTVESAPGRPTIIHTPPATPPPS